MNYLVFQLAVRDGIYIFLMENYQAYPLFCSVNLIIDKKINKKHFSTPTKTVTKLGSSFETGQIVCNTM